MNIKLIHQKTLKLSRLAVDAEGLQKRYTAHLMLYDAACMAGRRDEIAQRREECHTLLDAILDNACSVHVLSREVQEIISTS